MKQSQQQQKEKVQSIKQTKLPVLPPICVLNLGSTTFSKDSYSIYFKTKQKKKEINQPQYENTEKELSIKYKNKYDQSQKYAMETVSTGIIQKVFSNNCLVCTICDKKIQESEFKMHLTYHPSIIIKGLLLGDYKCSTDQKQLFVRNKVTHIVNAANQLRNHFNQRIKYLNLFLYDVQDERVIQKGQKAAAFIHDALQQEGQVLVHCMMGKSRSVSVVLIYLMKYKGMRLSSALNLVQSLRPIAQPNKGYMKQLEQYDNELNDKSAYV